MTKAAFALAKEKGVAISFDPNIRRKLWHGQDYAPSSGSLPSRARSCCWAWTRPRLCSATGSGRIFDLLFRDGCAQYVAIEKGYFADRGSGCGLVTGFGADKVLTALISGEADIGFMGAEASIYAYQEGATDPAVNFAQLTQRAGNFLVAREEMTDFSGVI